MPGSHCCKGDLKVWSLNSEYKTCNKIHVCIGFSLVSFLDFCAEGILAPSMTKCIQNWDIGRSESSLCA